MYLRNDAEYTFWINNQARDQFIEGLKEKSIASYS